MVQRGQEYLCARVDVAAEAAKLEIVPVHILCIKAHLLRGTDDSEDLRAAREAVR